MVLDFKKLFNDNLEDIIKLLQIKSIYDEKTINEEMPYGLNVHKAFEYMKQLAQEEGFIIKEYDGHALSFEFGQGEKRIDIAGHLDVVYAEDEEFNIQIKDNKIFGRGTSDMKVPLFLCFIVLKELKKEYKNINKRIRLVLGGDEERTMNDLKYYVKKEGYPDFAFTPDGYFPLGIGEKGAIMWEIKDDYKGIIDYLDGGSQCNIVSPYAKAILNDASKLKDFNDFISKNNIDGKAYIQNGKTTIETKGIPCHASIPFKGRNATIDLLNIIMNFYDDEIVSNLYHTFNNYYGKGFNSFISDDQYKCLSVNLGILKIEDNKIFAQIDCRYPFGTTADDLTSRLKEALRLNVSLDYNDDPTLCDENDIYVKTMLNAYQKITNDYSSPIISGGVSYSKVFKHCVSYGPNTIDEVSMAHQKGEYIELNKCVKMLEIYYHTIEDLLLLDNHE